MRLEPPKGVVSPDPVKYPYYHGSGFTKRFVGDCPHVYHAWGNKPYVPPRMVLSGTPQTYQTWVV